MSAPPNYKPAPRPEDVPRPLQLFQAGVLEEKVETGEESLVG